MDQLQIKKFIAEKIPEGYSLSQIQDLLKEQNIQITFMELRLLASEIEESVFTKEEEKAAAAEKAKQPSLQEAPSSGGMMPPQEEPAYPYPSGMPQDRDLQEEPEGYTPPEQELEDVSPDGDATDAAPRGKTVVELSKLARPGAIASGTVKFGSGVTAEWIFDQMQRLSLANASGQPDQQDIREFQIELQKLFS